MSKGLLLALFVVCLGCSGEVDDTKPADPEGFPQMQFPDGNEPSSERISLGQHIFFDPLLSKDGTVSCGSCHLPAHAFSDTTPVSAGVHPDIEGFRNAYSLANVGYQQALFMEGGVPTLEIQALAPLGEETEMDFSIHLAAERMKGDPYYVTASERAYDRPPDGYVITRALGAFQRSLISADSPYDHYRLGEVEALSADALAGLDIFRSSRCTDCHTEPLFTDMSYHNIGLSLEYADEGRRRLTRKEEDEGKFKTPSLRNVGVTYPYMHDGSLSSLEEVVEHFAAGGKDHWNKSHLIGSQDWTPHQKTQLIAFLHSLTDSTFISKTYR